jgi:hypothetical protein
MVTLAIDTSILFKGTSMQPKLSPVSTATMPSGGFHDSYWCCGDDDNGDNNIVWNGTGDVDFADSMLNSDCSNCFFTQPANDNARAKSEVANELTLGDTGRRVG